MLERIIELLLGLAVAAAAAVGIDTATTTPHGVGPDSERIGERVEWAQQQAAERRADAAVLDPAAEGEFDEAAVSGIETALAALARIMESAPEAAEGGLDQAWESVSGAAANGPDEEEAAEDRGAAPVEVPAGPPADLPAGAPDGVPPVDIERP